MSKKPAEAHPVTIEEDSVPPYIRKCIEDSWPVALNQLENILKKIDDDITYKDLEKKRRPYAVQSTMSICFKESILSVLYYDSRGDDRFLLVDEACEEPKQNIIDNFKGAPQVNKVIKEEPI